MIREAGANQQLEFVMDMDSKVILGIDIGGTKCAAVLATSEGKIVARSEIETVAEDGPNVILQRLIDEAIKLLNGQKLAGTDLKGVGISCGGPLDTQKGVVFEVPNLPGWNGIEVRAIFEKAFRGTKVVLENDANSTALAE